MRYYILAKRDNEMYTVGYDNQATDDFENIMFFNSTDEAKAWINSSEAKAWADCRFDIAEDNDDIEE